MQGNFQMKIMKLQKSLSERITNLLNRLTTIRDTNKKDGILYFVFISAFICLISLIVFLTGGTNAYVHLMYLPIIISVFIFERRISLIICIFAGFMVGPFMPYNVKENIMQTPNTWIFRCIMFTVVMMIIQILTGHIRNINDLEKKKAYEDFFTGYPNSNKWKSDFGNLMRYDKSYSVILFEVTNIETIARNVDYFTGQEIYKRVLELSSDYFEGSQIYAVNNNRMILSVPYKGEENVYNDIKDFINLSKQPIYINDIPVAVIIKAGIVALAEQGTVIEEIVIKLEKALDQACHSQKEAVVYNRNISEKISKHYETLVSIYHAFNNEEFHIAYQPKVDVNTGIMIGAEALLRWENNPYKDLSVSEIIRIAEDAEFISIITRWVIQNAVRQIKLWEDQNKDIRVSVNLSSRDLNDDSIVKHTINCIEQAGISPGHLEFELTERSIIEDEEKVFAILKKIQNYGIKISLDDYGTGHNSLIYLSSDLFCFDSIKIEKMFIDAITNLKTKILIAGVVKAAHENNMEVIAEGVETKVQYDIMKEMGCDTIQGYYFSKPVVPEELENIFFPYA